MLSKEEISRGSASNFLPSLDILVTNAGIQRYIDLKKGYDELKSVRTRLQ